MKGRIDISDHAVLMYLARVRGIDVEQARDDIARTVAVAEEHEDVRGVRLGAFTYRIIRGTVVDVVRANWVDRRTGGFRKGVNR